MRFTEKKKNTTKFKPLIGTLLILITIVSLSCSNNNSQTSEDEAKKEENNKPAIESVVAKGKEAQIKKIKSFMVFVSVKDADQARLYEDALLAELIKKEYSVVSRAKTEKVVQTQLSGKDNQQVQIVKLAKEAKAAAVIVGTFDLINTDSESTEANIQQNKISSTSIQIIDVKSEEVLEVIYIDYPEGASFYQAAKDVVESIKK